MSFSSNHVPLLTLLLMIVLAQAPAAASAPVNLLKFDTSFEVDSGIWVTGTDDTAAFDGRRSLLLSPGKTDYLGGVVFDRLPANTPLVFSLYARGEGNLRVGLSSQDNWAMIASGDFPLTGEWKRYSLKIAPRPQTAAMRISFKKDKKAKVNIDAMQLNRGHDAVAYTPDNDLRVGFDALPVAGNVLSVDSAALEMKLNVHNYSAVPQDVVIAWRTEKYDGKAPAQGKKKVLIPAGQTAVVPLQILPKRARGYYVIRVQAQTAGSGAEVARTDFPLLVADKPPQLSEQSCSGMFPCGQQPEAAMRDIGVSWFRTILRWKHTPRKADGTYVFAPVPWGKTGNGINWMATVNISEMPGQFQGTDGKLKDLSEAGKYLAAMVDAYRGNTRYWEFNNEPDLSWGKIRNQSEKAEHYAEIIKAASPKIRAVEPDAVILAGGVSGVDFDFNCLFLRKTLEVAGKEIDVVPVHPYAHARFISSADNDQGPEESGMGEKYRMVQTIIKEYGGNQDIWAGEIGWGLDVREDFLSPAARRHGAYLLRTMLISRAHQVKKVMYFLSELCLEREYYYYGLWRNLAPMPAAAAYATAAQLLENVKNGRDTVTGDLHIAVYEYDDGRALGALWLGNKHGKIKMTLPFAPDQVEVRDMFNNPLELPVGRKIELEVTGEPLMILGRKLTFRQLEDGLKAADRQQFPIVVQWLLKGDRSVAIRMKNITDKTVAVDGGISGYGIAAVPKLEALKLPPGTEKTVVFYATGKIDRRMLTLELKAQGQRLLDTFTPQVEYCRKRGNAHPWTVELRDRKYLLPVDPGIAWDGPEDLGIKAEVSWDNKALYFDAVVRDDIHHANPGAAWNGDGIQFAVCPEDAGASAGNGYKAGDLELNFCLTPAGAAVQAGFSGNRDTRALIKAVRADIRREGTNTIYRCAVPWAVIGVKDPKGKVFGINFTVNDCDQPTGIPAQREYWLGLTYGIGESKNPKLFRKFIMTE